MIAALVFLGKRIAFNSIKTVTILTITLEIANQVVPVYDGEIMLAAIFAGVLQGIGLGIILLRGSTTGGTDIVTKLIQLRYPHFSTGRVLFALDAIVLVVTALVYGSIRNSMYALILVFVSSKVVDAIVYGSESGRMLMIISDKHEAISDAIHTEMDRGSTLLDGKGTYTDTERPVLICAITITEFQALKRLIYDNDPDAFVISLVADDVFGEGFTPFAERLNIKE